MTLLTRKETAERLRCSVRTVRRLQQAGALRTTRVSERKVFTSETEINRYLSAATGRRGV